MGNKKPIGVFDSGMGGLTVLAELVRAMPHEDFIYLGDTARVPYGSKSPHVVQRYSLEVANYLLSRDIKFLVIACNTASAHAEEMLSQKLSVSVTGVINPGVQALLSQTKNSRVGVIGTRSTIKSGVYERTIANFRKNVSVFSRACPLFVPLVEEGWVDKKITDLVINEYLSEMIREGIDTLVLGCTHYPLLKSAIQKEYPELLLIDSSIETARRVQTMISEEGIENDPGHQGNTTLLFTDVTDQMERLEKFFYGLPFRTVQEIDLQTDH